MQSVCERTPLNIKLDPEVIANIRTRTDEIVAEMATDETEQVEAGSVAGDVALADVNASTDVDAPSECANSDAEADTYEEPVGVADVQGAPIPSKSPNVHWVKKDKTFVAKRHNADDTWSYKRFRCFAPHMQSMVDASHVAAVKWATRAADCS